MSGAGQARWTGGPGRREPDPSGLGALLGDRLGDRAGELGREVLHFVPDAVAMLRGVLADPRVPQSAKVEAGAALAYLVSPVNKLTSWVPVVGKVDDVAVVAFALRRLLVGAGEPVLRDHWRGHPRGLEVLLGLTTALSSPKGLLRRSAILRAVLAALGEGAAVRPGAGRVIDGEVVDAEPPPARPRRGGSSSFAPSGSTPRRRPPRR